MKIPAAPIVVCLALSPFIACGHAAPSHAPSSPARSSTPRVLQTSLVTVRSSKPLPPSIVTSKPAFFSSPETGIILVIGITGNRNEVTKPVHVTRMSIALANPLNVHVFEPLLHGRRLISRATIDDRSDGMLYKLYDVTVVGINKQTAQYRGDAWISLKFEHLRFRCGPPYCAKVTWGATTFGSRS